VVRPYSRRSGIHAACRRVFAACVLFGLDDIRALSSREILRVGFRRCGGAPVYNMAFAVAKPTGRPYGLIEI
jgi:hypothetical protein